MSHDVAIIGCGRVGLPLALGFADRGLRTIGIDNDAERLGAVRSRRMPFEEPGAAEVLERVDIEWSARAADAAQADAILAH
jgi:UDP-N-acetyl-D-mannosaminuronic acid dehydrogenase